MWCKPGRLITGLLALVLISAAVAQETRKIETKQGTIELKGQPQRVVTLDEIALDVLLDGQSQTVSVVRWNPQGPIAMSSQLFAGQLLTQLGLDSTELARQLVDRPHSDTLSLENLPLVDADWLVLASLNADGKKSMDEAMAQPVFQRLKAVQNGHVKVVDGQVWSSGAGPLAARVLLDDLKHMLGNDSAN
ncbi:ABC transporter substrate-binding protein [Thiopseudomonas denitrificans]|uniref:Substrate-binding family protein n=1 Tax=Thiopseudomonas denitrificans TaxID=1501432 RepID=A0A4R6U962_9GAMM|nr:ABC transporter substrate-binding protein [Thiopseudomonas denitrificans]TDQ39604.1 substrate-binding family protein [Thiopseudomonas denitrificans]